MSVNPIPKAVINLDTLNLKLINRKSKSRTQLFNHLERFKIFQGIWQNVSVSLDFGARFREII